MRDLGENEKKLYFCNTKQLKIKRKNARDRIEADREKKNRGVREIRERERQRKRVIVEIQGGEL